LRSTTSQTPVPLRNASQSAAPTFSFSQVNYLTLTSCLWIPFLSRERPRSRVLVPVRGVREASLRIQVFVLNRKLFQDNLLLFFPTSLVLFPSMPSTSFKCYGVLILLGSTKDITYPPPLNAFHAPCPCASTFPFLIRFPFLPRGFRNVLGTSFFLLP